MQDLQLRLDPVLPKTRHRLRRVLQRLGMQMHRAMNPVEKAPVSEAEGEAYAIFRKMIQDPENELLASPQGKRYIKSDSQEMLLVLGNGSLSIVNHVYGYNVPLSQKTEIKMKNIFNRELESRCEKIEDDYTHNIKHSLKTIINRMDHEK